MTRRARRVLVTILLPGLVLASAGLALLAWRSAAPYRGYTGSEQHVEILPGDGTPVIARRLVDAGIVRDRWVWRTALWRTGLARRLQAGEYRFDRPMRPIEVVEKLARGDVVLRTITFPEGLTVREMSRVFEARGFGSADDFLAAARDVAPIHAIDPAATDLEGYLFPATYALPRRAVARDLVGQMVARFLAVFTEDLRGAAASQGLTVREAVTLASLVEKETAQPDERPRVAGVYLARLRLRMPLQCDPTVIYALDRAGRYHGNLTRQNLGVDSPYNTYRYRGLPPGPIAAPGRSSLEAAAAPLVDGSLYFVSRNDGSHVFATTLEAHNRNVRRYQIEPARQQRAGTPRR